jgi:hypothetical protein
MHGETPYIARAYNSSSEGWYTPDPKIKRRAHQLSWWGVAPSAYCYENSKLLNPQEVNNAYETLRDEKYPSRYRTEIRELKSYFKATTSDLEVAKRELESQTQKNSSLEHRLEILERSKESGNK